MINFMGCYVIISHLSSHTPLELFSSTVFSVTSKCSISFIFATGYLKGRIRNLKLY